MATKYRVELNRETCIGTVACAAVDDQNWILAEDGKIQLKDSKHDAKTGLFFRNIDTAELEKWKETAAVCPVLAIRITQLGKKIE